MHLLASDVCCVSANGDQQAGIRESQIRRQFDVALAACLLMLTFLSTGCATAQYSSKRNLRKNPLAMTLRLMNKSGPTLTDRTVATLSRYGLQGQYEHNGRLCVNKIRDTIRSNVDPELLHALIELSYVEGKKAEQEGKVAEALNQYGIALTSSYDYLFGDALSMTRNRYDPQFRKVCDLYNESLEDALRLLCSQNRLAPGKTYRINTKDREFVVHTHMGGKWDSEEFDHYEFVSDFEIKTLRNKHTTYGLGVPLIAVRRPAQGANDREKYYPDELSYPVTAMIRCVPSENDTMGETTKCVMEFYDPLTANQIQLADHWVPLETDLTTPLAYFLDNPEFQDRNEPTSGLLNPAAKQEDRGLFMLEPYDPDRIPVLMVHGLWSSASTWMDMFNDLRSFPEIRQRYQFWFYLYPSGQPFWLSAEQMRSDLKAMRQTFDPGQRHTEIDKMVLVGHSMGGLISRMQTIDSGDDFWRIVSDQPASRLRGPEQDRNHLVSTLFFKPNQSIRRVITISTPHRGSRLANDYTRWLASKVIKLPTVATSVTERLLRDNPRFFRDTSLLTMSTAFDSLAPDSPIFPVMQRAKYAPGVKFHNIIGVLDDPTFIQRRIGPGDGVVQLESARAQDVESELIVNADHTSVHMDAKTIYEVRRILLSHMQEIDSYEQATVQEVESSPVPDREDWFLGPNNDTQLVPAIIQR